MIRCVTMKNILILPICLIALNAHSNASGFDTKVEASLRNFANTQTTQDISLNSTYSFKPKNELNSKPKFEVKLLGYLENTKSSEIYIDVPKIAYRYSFNSNSFLTAGRFHPLEELDNSYKANYLDSIGNSWVINEQNPLKTENVGWIGVAQNYKISKHFRVNFTYSPVFIPDMSPSIYYTKDKLPSSQSLFARTPPSKVKINNNLYLPLMISLDNVNLKEILLQNQAFIGLNYRSSKDFSVSLFAYTAPNSVAETNNKEKLVIQNKDLHILVNASPYFKREHNIGFSLNRKILSIESLYKIDTRKLTLSSSLQMTNNIQIGFLHSFNDSQNNADATIITSTKDEKLVWLKSNFRVFENFEISSNIIKNLDTVNNGVSLNIGASYNVFKNVNIFTQAQVFTGSDNSYYGTWRNLDFISTGITAKW